MLKIEYSITSDFQHFTLSNKPKISYSNKKIHNEFLIVPSGLLFTKEFEFPVIKINKWEGINIFFQTSEEANIPFDLFFATFFLVSRYEEYLPFVPDKFGRFNAKDSIPYKLNILEEPLINQWVKIFKDKILHHYPSLQFPENNFKFINTIDVDIAYAYKNKGFFRTLFSFGNNLLSLNLNDNYHRLKGISGFKDDPIDMYQKIINNSANYNIEPIWFFQVGKWGKYDRNNSLRNKQFRTLIYEISKKFEVGLHSSFQSNFNFKLLKQETESLEQVIGKKITKSRQHFLYLKFPETYHRLISIGIKEDYSMGYSEVTGFRAGIASPYKFFDLKADQPTDFMIYPFCAMDVTLRYFLKLKPDEAIDRIAHLLKKVREVDGTFIVLWHNDSFSDWNEWKGWQNVYSELLKKNLLSDTNE